MATQSLENNFSPSSGQNDVSESSPSNQQTSREKEVDELNERFHKNFLDKITDTSMPDWRRQLLARQMAEKAKKEYEEKKKVEEYEARLKNMPGWKRALVEKKEAESRAAQAKPPAVSKK